MFSCISMPQSVSSENCAMAWQITRSDESPYFGEMVGAAAIMPCSKPGTTWLPCSHNRIRAAANFGVAAAAAGADASVIGETFDCVEVNGRVDIDSRSG
jgi:hypothetical protein